jgi:hypothetical protein
MQFARYFRLTDPPGVGVRCDESGLFVGATPLLERDADPEIRGAWRPRPLADLECDLSETYGAPVALADKLGGLASVARALNRRDIAHAQVAALLLGLPDPPEVAKSEPTQNDLRQLARALEATGLLKGDWDPAKHPRWPAKSPDGVGGQFAPRDGAEGASDAEASVVQAQIAIPAPPIDIPAPVPFPLPSEIVPPIIAPNVFPRSLPQNPYPDRPECVRESQDAFEFCWNLKTRGQLGKGDYRGMGRTLRDCILGRVSESCGGNSTSV